MVVVVLIRMQNALSSVLTVFLCGEHMKLAGGTN